MEQAGLPEDVLEHGCDAQAVRRVVNATGKRRLLQAERAALRTAFAGGFLCLEDLRSRGIVHSAKCPRCGKADTVPHRLFDACGPPGLQARRKQLRLDELYEKAAGSTRLKDKFPPFSQGLLR